MLVVAHAPTVFSIDGFLDARACGELVALAEARGFAAAGVRTAQGTKPMPTIRNNERAQFEAPDWIALLWQRLAAAGMPGLDGQAAVGLPRELRFYKYSAGQRFKMHKDGPWSEDGLSSKLTFLVYLNQGYEGGDTVFKEFRVTPKTGSALLFVHDTWHEGAALTGGIKYVLRSDVLYSPANPQLDRKHAGNP
ncbi:prolyl hydroxylase family protein [Massilia scottii]|uniref:prolyl hydroxylase family protein n=1 Tax=Massilia scottii TaxID=3057166 RepID=UPI0027965344|nr:2OG-Fe(II) oxygenase [Massilia sp. CCM 9029]MDQ1830853.1 2OG-Fe(II) oxygenase [Massilia sp. CCM 9029]